MKYIILILLVTSCKGKYKAPLAESCIHNEDNSAECTDLRIENPDERSYTRYELENYICTSDSDYRTYYNYIQNLREKLIKCEAGN
jgi:hypothetical protein